MSIFSSSKKLNVKSSLSLSANDNQEHLRGRKEKENAVSLSQKGKFGEVQEQQQKI